MEPKTKKYSLWQNLAYAFSKQWRIHKPTVICCAVAVVIQVGQPFLAMIMPKIVIDQLQLGVTAGEFIGAIVPIGILMVIAAALRNYTDRIVNSSIGTLAIYDENLHMSIKQTEIDYELLEDPVALKIHEGAKMVLTSNHAPANNIARYTVNVLVNFFGLVLYAFVIATVHPAVAILPVLTALAGWLFLSAYRRYYEKHREKEANNNQKLWYMQEAIHVPKSAKDIRMYSMIPWLNRTIDDFKHEAMATAADINWRKTRATLFDALFTLLRDGAAYGILIYMMVDGGISLGTFVLAVGAVSGLAAWFSGLMRETSDLIKASADMNKVRAYYDVENRSNGGEGPAIDLENAPEINIKNLSYKYPKAEKPTLENVNLTINKGERIAVVGSNGAGKTTLIKLICGLYTPTEGSIEIDGTDMTAFNRKEYFRLFSPVFQDIHVLAESISQNISQAPEAGTDGKRVVECLQKAGLYDKVQSLKEKEHSLMVPSIHEDGVTFSGGEMQKLALARALYKGAPVILLDEPTAALDPIAESLVYNQYASLTEGKTSIYISHRLASTKFCDRIVFLDEGGIAEMGNHDQLMALNGKYAHMFELQAQYYKEGGMGR